MQFDIPISNFPAIRSYAYSVNVTVIDTLSGENTIGYENGNHFERGVLEKYRKSKKPILYKRHETKGVDNSENNRIILIVRNYKEVIVRHNGKVKSIMQDY